VHHRARAHDGVRLHQRALHHDGARANDGVVADGAALQQRARLDHDVVADHGARRHVALDALGRVHDGAVADAAVRADGHVVQVAAHDGAVPHGRVLVEVHAADDGRVGRHKHGRVGPRVPADGSAGGVARAGVRRW
jgi:hypothetical protein